MSKNPKPILSPSHSLLDPLQTSTPPFLLVPNTVASLFPRSVQAPSQTDRLQLLFLSCGLFKRGLDLKNFFLKFPSYYCAVLSWPYCPSLNAGVSQVPATHCTSLSLSDRRWYKGNVAITGAVKGLGKIIPTRGSTAGSKESPSSFITSCFLKTLWGNVGEGDCGEEKENNGFWISCTFSVYIQACLSITATSVQVKRTG